MVRGLASSVSGEVSFPDLQTATSVSSYSPSSAHGWGAGGRCSSVSSSSSKDTNPMGSGPTLKTSFNLNYLPKGPSPNTVTQRLRASTHWEQGNDTIQSRAGLIQISPKHMQIHIPVPLPLPFLDPIHLFFLISFDLPQFLLNSVREFWSTSYLYTSLFLHVYLN